jgi:hypothetical protein
LHVQGSWRGPSCQNIVSPQQESWDNFRQEYQESNFKRAKSKIARDPFAYVGFNPFNPKKRIARRRCSAPIPDSIDGTREFLQLRARLAH